MIIAGIVKSSFIDFPSCISTVVFLGGCNYNCYYCHNKQLISNPCSFCTTEELFDFLLKRKGLIDGVVISGGEPTINKYLPEFIKKIKNMGYKIKLDTNGTNFEMLKLLINQNLIDYVAMDIKSSFKNYNKVVQVENEIQKVVDSANFLINQNKINYEFRTTCASVLTNEDFEGIGKSLVGAKKYYLQKCNEEFVEAKFKNNLETKLNMESAINILKKYKINAIIR